MRGRCPLFSHRRAGGAADLPLLCRQRISPASSFSPTTGVGLLQLLGMLARLVLQRLAGGEARLQGCRFGLESSRLTGEGVGALAGPGGRLVTHLQAAEIAERHTARRALDRKSTSLNSSH